MKSLIRILPNHFYMFLKMIWSTSLYRFFLPLRCVSSATSTHISQIRDLWKVINKHVTQDLAWLKDRIPQNDKICELLKPNIFYINSWSRVAREYAWFTLITSVNEAAGDFCSYRVSEAMKAQVRPHVRILARAFIDRIKQVWKQRNASTKIETSSPTI